MRARPELAPWFVSGIPLDEELAPYANGEWPATPSRVGYRMFELWDCPESARALAGRYGDAERHGFMQRAFDNLCLEMHEQVPWVDWRRFETPFVSRWPPRVISDDSGGEDRRRARRASWIASGFVVQFDTLTVVISSGGTIVDAFGTCGSVEQSTGTHLLLLNDERAHVRNLRDHSFGGELPDDLASFVAVSAPAKVPCVVDLRTMCGYLLDWYDQSQQLGPVTSADGRYVWSERGAFVRELASGRPVLDARPIRDAMQDEGVVGFARRSDGSWRLLASRGLGEPLRIIDEQGRTLSELPMADCVALSPDASRLLSVDEAQLRVRALDTDGETSFGLSALRDALPPMSSNAQLGIPSESALRAWFRTHPRLPDRLR